MRSLLFLLRQAPIEIWLIVAGTGIILLVLLIAARYLFRKRRRLNREDFVLSSQQTYFQDENRRVH
ncbi:MAG: hypothetical protein HC884_09370 [Chloroflexaceae bacterium]|nr:hypothetical protein [Chloroflexaceae bacterium]